MASLWLEEDEKKRILSAIDAGEWQHSWHLPRDDNGYIRWGDETHAKCREILERKRDEHLAFSAKCAELAQLLGEIIAARAANAAEGEAT